MRFRLLVVARLIGAWAAWLALLGGLGLLTGSWQILWLVEILFLASIPLVASASLVCFVLAHSVASHPFPWTVSALFISLLVGSVVAGTAGAIFSLMLSVPAGVLFLLSLRQWPTTAGNT
jgi:hypothetical protein